MSGPQFRAPLYSIRTSGFFPLILNPLILYTRARGFFAHTHTRIASNPAAFSLHHRLGQPLSQGACNSASSHQRGERRAASVQSCAPVGPWPAVQESSATARLSPRRARHFHSHSHAPRYSHTHAPRHLHSHAPRYSHTHAPRHLHSHAPRYSHTHAPFTLTLTRHAQAPGLAQFFVPVVVLVSWVIEPLLWPPGERSLGRGCPGRCGDVRRCSVGATPLFSPERPPKVRIYFR